MSKENIFDSPKYLSGRLGTKQSLYKILEIDHKTSLVVMM